MNKELKTKLVNALKKAGMSEGLADSMDSLDDNAVNDFIAGLPNQQQAPSMKEVVSSDAFKKYLEEGGFDELLTTNKTAQSLFDRKVTKSLKTFENNLLGKTGGNTETDEVTKNVKSDDPAMQAVLEMLQEQKKELDALKNQQFKSTSQTAIDKALSESKLPEKQRPFLARMLDPSSDQPLSEQVAALEEVFGKEGAEQSKPTGPYRFEQGTRKNEKRSASELKTLGEMAAKMSTN